MNISNTIHACCMDVLPLLQPKSFDLAHVDPPYFSGPERRGHYGPKHSRIGIKRVDYAKTETWEIPNESYFDQLFRVSRYQIIWGANYFTFQKPTFKKVEPFKTPRRHELEAFIAANPTGWIVWDKCNGNNSFNDFELAWTSWKIPTYVYRFMWNGAMQGSGELSGHIMQGNKKLNQKRIHPTEKPIKLYRFINKKYCSKGYRVIDTHLGSGSHRIACFDLNLPFFGIEKDRIHFLNQEKRFLQHQSQLDIFSQLNTTT